MKKIKNTIIYFRWPLFAGLIFLLILIGCQPESTPVTVTRPTPEPTTIPLATPVPSPAATIVPSPPTETVVTAVPTIPPTIEPTAFPPSPTAAGWQINERSNFLIREERNDIYLLRPGKTSQHITPGKLVAGQPWSPDGTKFIFDSSSTFEADPPPELAIADLETGQTSVINLLFKPYHIYWSPDGKYLLYTNGGENNTIQIVLYDFEDGENKVAAEITREAIRLFYLVGWSPDSQKIAFVSGDDVQIDLFVLEVESLAIRQLTNTPDIETIAVWSTMENRLLFGTKNNHDYALEVWPYGAGTLYLIDDSGENLTRLSDSYYYSAAWSPDGEKIAYSDGGQICILEVEIQTEICPLKDVPPYNEYYASIGDAPAWSPDGNWLAFQATGHEEGQCYRVYFWELSTNLVTPVDISTCGVDSFYWSK